MATLQYGGLLPDEYIEKLESVIGKMKDKFSAMRVASQKRDERTDELIKRTRVQADQISTLQTEVSMQVNTNSDNAEKTMAALIRDKLQVIDQQQQQLRESRDEINLLKRTVALAETQAQELSMWRKKEPLLKRLENMVQQSEASEGVKSAQLAEMRELQSEFGDHKEETDVLLEIKNTQVETLETQLADVRKNFQQSQLHTTELLKAKDSAWGIKLKQAVQALKQSNVGNEPDTVIEQLRNELAQQSSEMEALRAEMNGHLPSKENMIAVDRDTLIASYKDKIAQQLEDSKRALRRTRGEVEILSTVSSRDKEVIASQKREFLEHGKEQEKVNDQLQTTCHTLQKDIQCRDAQIAKLMDTIREKNSEFLSLRTLNKFSSVVQGARAHHDHDEAERHAGELQAQVDKKEVEVGELDRLLEKRGLLIDTQRDFSNEVLGQPLSTETIKKTLNEINDGLIQVIRDSSGVSWTTAESTIQCVLEVLFERLPGGKVVNAINQVMRPGPFWGENDGGQDRVRLEGAALVLAGYEDNSHTGNALSFEDGVGVVKAIDEITTIVIEGSAAVATTFLRNFQHVDMHCDSIEEVPVGEFDVLLMLTALYRETGRVEIRRALCRTFHVMGHLLPMVHHVLQNTSLPLEIARDVKDRGNLGRDSEEDKAELKEALDLAVVMLGHGDVLPALDLEYMDDIFVTDLLVLAESEAEDDLTEQIKTLALEVVLAYNLQFAEKDPFVSTKRRSRNALVSYSSNSVLSSLSSFTLACQHKNISDRLLKLANRLNDPLDLPEFAVHREHRTTKQNSVLKLLVDIFSNENLAQCFFGISDLQVLVDISIREIGDKEPDDVQRLQFVQLLASIANRSTYEQLEPELKNTKIVTTFEALVNEPNWNKSKTVEVTSRVAQEALRYM